MKPHRIFAVLAVVTPSLMACGSGFDPDSSGAATTQATESSVDEPDDDPDTGEPTRSTEIGLPPDLTFPEPEDTWPTDPESPPIITADPSTPEGPTDPTTPVTQPPDTEPSPAPPPSGKGDVYPTRLFESLTDSGQQQASGIDWRARPGYAVGATIDPDSGRIQGGLSAMVPIGSDTDQVVMRWFPNAVADDATIEQVTANGHPAEFEVDESVVTIDAGDEHPDEIVVTMEFGYTVPDFEPQAPTGMPTGDALDPTEIGLLANSDGTMMLGHWFPVWIPERFDADPMLDGYGDIANYPAGGIIASLQVPDGSIVRTSGERLEGEDGDGRLLEGGMGLRDLTVVVMDDPEQATTDVNGIRVAVMAPAGTADVDVVLEQSARSVKVLSDAFGDYPWTEFDVIAAPLGSGVGGMEWPGMIWIESTIFEGGIPGMGDPGDLGDLGELEDVLGEITDDTTGDTGGDGSDGGDLLGDLDLMIGTIREWTIAHETGHMWWHSLIGNDSIVAPVVDEPLAQHSACLVLRQTHPEGEQVCDIHTLSTYSQLRSLLGVEDTPANQPSDEFDSSTQYGAVVYGKAPGFYRELETRFGVEQVTAALAAVVEQHAFGQISDDDLRTGLGEQLGDPAAVDELWSRWLEEANGDEDIAN